MIDTNLARKTSSRRHQERFDVIVIGGGQAGLSVGYHLARRGLRFVILDASERVGDAWRHRWDSLRLFTPAHLDGLDGMPFPGPRDHFPTKDEMADYLEAYATRFQLPVRTGIRVERLSRKDGHYVVEANGHVFEAEQVVVAMAGYQQRRVPEFAKALSPDIVQLHSSEYRSTAQFKPGSVLVVGAGNSGAEIAAELRARGHETILAGTVPGEVPFKMGSFLGRWVLVRLLLRVVFHRVLTMRTPMGRKARPKVLTKGTPLIRTRSTDLERAGVTRVPRVTGVENGLPVVQDGRVLNVANVVWCSGYDAGFSWIDLPIFGDDGMLMHEGGVVTSQPGLYFVGLTFLYAMSSSMIHGVGRDAARIAASVAIRHERGAESRLAERGPVSSTSSRVLTVG